MVSCNDRLLSGEAAIGMWRDARDAAADRYFLAWALDVYRQARQLDETGLTRYLKCSPGDLPHLALCRRPEPHEPCFNHSVDLIAAFARCDPERLVTVLTVAAAVGAV